MSSAYYRTGKESNESSSNEEDSHEVIVDRINKESLELKSSVKECRATENVACSANSEEEKSSSEESAMSIIKKNERMKNDFVLKWGINRYKSQWHQDIMNERKQKLGDNWKGYVKNDKKRKADKEFCSDKKKKK